MESSGMAMGPEQQPLWPWTAELCCLSPAAADSWQHHHQQLPPPGRSARTATP